MRVDDIEEISITPNSISYQNTFEINKEKIQRDLNSPSASVRLRALRAIKSPTKTCYYFDVPHKVQDIVTEEERNALIKPKSFQDVMKDVIIFVDVRLDGKNNSADVKSVIESLGVNVNEKFVKNTTHVIFKDGLLSTYNKAKKLNIPVVPIQWFEQCKKYMTLMSTNLYKINNLEKYENPELFGKAKRKKFSEWEWEPNYSTSPKNIKRTKIENLNGKENIQKKKNLLFVNNTPKVHDLFKNDTEFSFDDNNDEFVTIPKIKESKEIEQNLNKIVLMKNYLNQPQKSEQTKNKTKRKSDARKTITGAINMEETLLNTMENFVDNNVTLEKTKSKSLMSARKSLNFHLSDKKSNVSSMNDMNMEETLVDLTDQNTNVVQKDSMRKTCFTNNSIELTLIENIAPNLNNQTKDKNDGTELLNDTPKTDKKLEQLFTVKKRKLFLQNFLRTPSPSESMSLLRISASLEKKNLSKNCERNDINDRSLKSTLSPLTMKKGKENYFGNDFLSSYDKEKRLNLSRSIAPIKSPRADRDSRSSASYFDFQKSKLTSTSSTIIQSRKKILVCTNVNNKEQLKLVKKAVKKLGNFTMENTVTNNTTHLICFQSKRTMNLFRAMIRGLWILNRKWISDSIESGKWLYEEEYEIRDFSRTIQICRSQRQAFGKNYKLQIFESLGPIYVSPKCRTHKNITELIMLCNGEITENKNNAKYIIGDFYNVMDNNQNEIKYCVNEEWVIDCIMNNRIKKIGKYKIKEII